MNTDRFKFIGFDRAGNCISKGIIPEFMRKDGE